MTKQKRGFWLFIFSLIPGAGEMYMGFRKQGISIMLLFWAIIAFASGTGIACLLMFLPILWFYSFFNVHNMKSLSEEEFYTLEDSYILHMEALIGDTETILCKYRTLVAVFLVLIGFAILWNNLLDALYVFLPNRLAEILISLIRDLPQTVTAIVIIAIGIFLLSNKKRELKQEKESQEHYWQPYRPYTEPKQEAPVPNVTITDIPVETSKNTTADTPEEPLP